MSLPHGTAPSATGTGVCLERRPPGAMPGGLLRFLITHSHDVRKKLHSYLRIFTWRAPQLCAATPTPLSAVQQYTPSSLSSTLKMVRSCPFLCMLYRVSNSLQGTVQIVRGWGTARDGEGELHLCLQNTDSTTNGNMLYFFFFNLQREGKALKTLS